jgi:glycosyltransferase involved in cell wall biosynthesis/SAM-dependent methyltransferase
MAIMVTTPDGARLKQGAHLDPEAPGQAPPDPATWPARRRHAFASPAIELFRRALLLPNIATTRAAILDDLSAYFGFSPEECVQRCVNWEEWSVREWQARARDSAEALAEFYHSTQSWAFDLLWYAYLQAEGYAYPVSVAIALTLPPPRPGMRHLDFGSGVGVTSQLFQVLGYETELADISTSLLAFARFRYERRGLRARQIDLNVEQLESGRYDVITAIDTLVHVPDIVATARELHRALKPGGLLFANFDVRPPTPENAWHLYADDLPLRWALQRAGFEPEENLDGMITRYRRVEPHGPAHLARGARDIVLLRSPLRPTVRRLRAWRARARARRAAHARTQEQPGLAVRRVVIAVQSVALGGMEQHALDLAAELKQRGIEVRAIVPPDSVGGALAQRFAAAGMPATRLATDARLGRLAQLRGLWRLLRLLRAWRPDAVHLHTGGATGGIAVVALARLVGAAAVLTEHDVPAPAPGRRDRLARRAVGRLAHAVVAVSQRNARVRQARLGFAPPPGRMAVVRNGVPVPTAAPEERARNRARVRAELAIPEAAVVIGSVVRLVKGKGLETLIDAFARVRAAHPCVLVLVGEGPLRAALEARAAELGVHDAVHFAGYQADPAPYFDAFDLFALAVPAGSGSIALREAMARGLPAVITFGNDDDPVIDGVTGFTPPPNDPAALAEALRQLIADTNLRRALGRAAGEEMHARWSARQMADDLLAIYAARDVPPQLWPTPAPAAPEAWERPRAAAPRGGVSRLSSGC